MEKWSEPEIWNAWWRCRSILVGVGLLLAFAIALAACGGSNSDNGGAIATTPPGVVAGDVVSGAEIYKRSCSTCHGADLKGIDGLGLPLAPNIFVADHSLDALAESVKHGRSASDPDSSTDGGMPPKGGNPSLDDQDLLDVAAYLKAQN
jgi:mono/diheme cytochrome c family protein